MILLPNPIEFSWDEGNKDKNLLKHGVGSQECEEAFLNHPTLTLPDEKHSTTEGRYLLLGITGLKRKVSIIFTLRRNKVRVISARDTNKKERKFYEEKTQKDTKF